MQKKWEWRTTSRVRSNVLDAALHLFTVNGYDATTQAEIAAESKASVGSLYHHFGGGKDKIFAALADYFRECVAEAMGPEPGEGWERIYLEVAWQRRDLYRLLTSADSPPGHSATRRALQFFVEDLGVLEHDGGPLAPTLMGILIEAGQFIADLDDESEAQRIIAAACQWCRVVSAVGYSAPP